MTSSQKSLNIMTTGLSLSIYNHPTPPLTVAPKRKESLITTIFENLKPSNAYTSLVESIDSTDSIEVEEDECDDDTIEEEEDMKSIDEERGFFDYTRDSDISLVFAFNNDEICNSNDSSMSMEKFTNLLIKDSIFNSYADVKSSIIQSSGPGSKLLEKEEESKNDIVDNVIDNAEIVMRAIPYRTTSLLSKSTTSTNISENLDHVNDIVKSKSFKSMLMNSLAKNWKKDGQIFAQRKLYLKKRRLLEKATVEDSQRIN